MKHFQFIVTVILLTLLTCCSTDKPFDLEKEISLFNKLNDLIYSEKNIDSVKFFISEYDKLDNTKMRNNWIHNSFAQIIVTKEPVSDYHQDILKYLSNKTLNQIPLLTKGLVIYHSAVNSELDPVLMKQLNTDLSYSENTLTERYRLLLYKLSPSFQNEYLLDEVIKNSKFYLHSSTSNKNYRGLYRYLIAHSYYLKSKSAEKQNNRAQQKIFLAEASNFSPDQTDLKKEHIYYYDMHLLSGEKDYTNQYADFLLNEGDTTRVYNTLSSKASYNFDFLQKTKFIFSKLYPDSSFMKHWDRVLSKKLPVIPHFSLPSINNRTIDSKNFKGKWVVLDFWGTWCGPCRKELPKIQKLSNKINSNHKDTAELITIACGDTPATINKFIKDNNYDFTIVLSDQKVEKDFNVNSFPTKYLITPSGNYFQLYHNTNWEKIIETYISGS